MPAHICAQPPPLSLCLQLDVFRPLAFPLLTSPLVGATAAFDACRTLASCLPVAELSGAALPIACSLRLVMLTQKVGCKVLCCCKCVVMLGGVGTACRLLAAPGLADAKGKFHGGFL